MNNFINGTDKKIQYEEIIVCLFDGEYNLGAAALINSLVKFDFKGLIYIGYRGTLPDWVGQLKFLNDNCYSVSDDITIHFKQVETRMQLGYYKPFFIKEAFDTYKNTNKFYFFDSDITVIAPWSFFSYWLENGVCLCLDSSFSFLHSSHPWRKYWRHLAPDDITVFNNINYYFNSGFIGIERGSIGLIDRWIQFTEKYIEIGGDITRFVKDKIDYIKGDQDLLNAAITCSPGIEISIIGKDGMGFELPSYLMLHAISAHKPWNKRFVDQLFKSGHKPSLPDKFFFLNSLHPIRIFTQYTYRIKKFDMYMASLFGRVLD
ncbi:MAG TPA: hypothetical protein VGN20_11985 [Mucilaginibacter sp.]|jgi:hypothetical protein